MPDKTDELMKNIYRFVFILFGCMAAVSACQDIYEEEYGTVELDYNKIDVKAEGGRYTFMVYCTGSWTISLDQDIDWVHIDKTSGSGVTMINIEFDENTETHRSFNMTVSGGGETKVIPVTQTGVYVRYEISTVEDLLVWNQTADQSLPDRIILKNDISFSGQDLSGWKMKSFKGVFEGNGHVIDDFVLVREGESAFFSKVESAIVKDLVFGEGCSFTTTKAAESSNRIYAASLAVVANGTTTLVNVVNKGDVMAESGATGGTKGNYIGGICASYGATGDVEGCENHGDVTFSANPEAWMNCGGLFGEVTQSVLLKGCRNHGLVQFNGDNAANKSINLGGIVAGANTASFESCVNLGAVQSNAAAPHGGETYIGGIVGVNKSSVLGKIADCANGSATDPAAGALTNNSSSTNVLRMGGFVGGVMSCSPISGFSNYGAVTNNGEITNWLALGGVAGYIGGIGTDLSSVSGCANHGLVQNNVVNGRATLGGVVGFIQNANTEVTDVRNHGEVKNTGDASGSNGVTVGGIVGRIEAAANGENSISLCENHGNVAFAAASANDAKLMSGVAGILGGHAGPLKNDAYQPAKVTVSDCDNYGTVTKSGAGSSNVYVGGVVGFFNGTRNSEDHVADVVNCDNKAEASVLNGSTGVGAWDTYTGGVIGYHHVSGRIEGCGNYASVRNVTAANKEKSFAHYRLGGVVGSIDNGQITDCVNEGDVADESESNAGCVGGIVGLANTKTVAVTRCWNKGDVSGAFNSTTNSYPVCMGGIMGYAAVVASLDRCGNSGNITSNRTTKANNIYMGGLVGQMPKNYKITLTGCEVSGAMTNNTAENGNKTALGGFVGFCYDNEITDCHATMSITNVCATGEYIGGCIGQIESASVTDISDCSVNSVITTSATPSGTVYNGMFVGRLTHRSTSTTTVSNIYIKGTFNGTPVTAESLVENAHKGHCYGCGEYAFDPEQIHFGDFK